MGDNLSKTQGLQGGFICGWNINLLNDGPFNTNHFSQLLYEVGCRAGKIHPDRTDTIPHPTLEGLQFWLLLKDFQSGLLVF